MESTPILLNHKIRQLTPTLHIFSSQEAFAVLGRKDVWHKIDGIDSDLLLAVSQSEFPDNAINAKIFRVVHKGIMMWIGYRKASSIVFQT